MAITDLFEDSSSNRHDGVYLAYYWYWASEEGQKRTEGTNLDLVVGGFPCQSASVAAPKGKGLASTSKVFWAVNAVVQAVLQSNPDAKMIIECTDFSKRHPEDFKTVTEALGCESLAIDARGEQSLLQASILLDEL